MPTLDEILRDPVVYRVLRHEELVSEPAAGLPLPGGVPGTARRMRVLFSIWTIGWRWWLARGPWSVRPRWLRWAWWVGAPIAVGVALGSGGGIGGVTEMAVSSAFWVPVLGGIAWRLRLIGYARRQILATERQAQEAQIAEELARLSGSSQPQPAPDPNRLRG